MIPVFEAIIDDFDCGIRKISLVDLPAVESDFLFFNKENKTNFNFSIDNEEQRMVTGVIMRANFLIYRYSPEFGEYYIKYSPETIKTMAEKMMIDNTFNNINLMHEDGTDVEGVNLVELFIKDTSKGISPSNFEKIEDGSLFATYKINNDTIWEQIKLGTFKGFSLEGLFDIEEIQLKKQNNNNNKINNLMSTLFNRFLKSFVKCGSVETDKGIVYWVGEADLQIGDELFYNTENEEAVKVEDGEYTLNDGTVIVVKEGLVSEIREKDGEQEGELDMETENKNDVELEAETETENVAEELAVETENQEESINATLEANFAELRNEYENLKTQFKELKTFVENLVKKPAAEPIVEEYKKTVGTRIGDIPEFGSKSKIIR